MKINWRVVALIALLVAMVVMFYKTPSPPPVDWQPNFRAASKAPYGAYLLYESLPDLFPGATIETTTNTPKDAIDSATRGAYVIINTDFFPSEEDASALMAFAARGNTVFIASEHYGSTIGDTLGIVTERADSVEVTSGIDLVNPSLATGAGVRFLRLPTPSFFSVLDTANSVVLGVDGEGRANFLRRPWGKGAFLVSTLPYAYSNYSLLDSLTTEYSFRSLSYVGANQLTWDEYYKDGRSVRLSMAKFRRRGRGAPNPKRQGDSSGSQSGSGGSHQREQSSDDEDAGPESGLAFLLKHEALRWALFTALAGAVLFVIFMGRRRQRPIPIVEPLPNNTLDFVATVSQLYIKHGDHRNIVEKKVTYFFEHLRSAYGVNTGERTDEMYRVLAARSGVDLESVRQLFALIDALRVQVEVGKDDLRNLSDSIEAFRRQSAR